MQLSNIGGNMKFHEVGDSLLNFDYVLFAEKIDEKGESGDFFLIKYYTANHFFTSRFPTKEDRDQAFIKISLKLTCQESSGRCH